MTSKQSPTVFAVANQKGGVGKTTTSVNLSDSLALTKRSVLLIDMDPQGNSTTSSGFDKDQVTMSAADVLLKKNCQDTILKPQTAGYDLIAAGSALTSAEMMLMGLERREFRLKRSLSSLEGYEYVIIDCPPALNILTVNALVACHSVIIPVQCEYFALEGLSSLLKTIDRVRESANPELHIAGVLRTMYDSRNNLSRDVSDQLIQHFESKVFRSTIPRNVRLAEAPSHGITIMRYDQQSKGAEAYLSLAGEIISQKKM